MYSMTIAKPHILHYTSVLPGVGKTYWAIEQIVNHLSKDEGTLLYVAPTTRLMEEVYEEVRRKVKSKKTRQKIHLVSSDKHKSSVVSQLKLILNGGVDSYGSTVTPTGGGSVCIVSHECFMRIPFGYDDDGLPVFPNRDKIDVIFDEARKCVMSDFSIELPLNVVRNLSKLIPNLARELDRPSDPASVLDIPSKVDDIDDYHDNRYIHLDVDRFDTAEFDRIFAGNKYLRTKVRDRLRKVLTTAYGKSVRVYASMNIYAKTMQMSLHLVLVPANLFFGWKSVILLSAFFEHSQMFHLLKRISDSTNRPQRRRGRRIKRDSVELTRLDNLVNPEREAAMKEHYRKAAVTYIFDDSQLTTNKLRNGIPIATEGFDEDKFIGEFHELLKKRRSKSSTTKVRDLTLNSAVQMKIDVAKGRIKPSKHDRPLFHLLESLPAANLTTSPIAFMAAAARFLSQKWQEKHGYEVKPIPMCINVDPSYTRDVEAELGPPDEVRGEWIKVPFAAHGLNSFKVFNTIAFLACVNARPSVVSYMAHVAPTYQPKLDHTLDQAIQVLTRSCVRDLNSKESPLLIVTDLELATSISKQLGVKLIHPKSLGFKQSWKSFVVPKLSDDRSKEQQKEYWIKNSEKLLENRKKAYQKNKSVLLSKEKFLRDNNPEYRRMVSIRTNIYRLKREDPKGYALSKQFKDLQKELDLLIEPVKERNKELTEQWKAMQG